MVIISRTKLWARMKQINSILRNCSSDVNKSKIQKLYVKPSGYDTNIMLYNSSTKRKMMLKTKESGIISWYCCGPTVYDSAHIGHACCYIHFDIIRRIMEEVFYQNVILVMGITDIDDKIINRANMEGVDYRTISQYYEEEFFKDMGRLNVKKPVITARVTDYIPEIVGFVSKIIDRGYGYITADNSVNFSVNKYSSYELFSRFQEEGTSDSSGKIDSRDFALWKGIKPGEPSWSSPWGKGRPGWHIECSAIASKLLGNRLDIHSGGIDLQFPHHQNEEAQCCVYHDVRSWVTYWMHTGHLYLKDSMKMSKSLKNTISVDSFLSQYSSDHLRMLCLMIPYRNGIEYGDDVMNSAVAVYNKFSNFIFDCNDYIKGVKPLGSFDESTLFQDLEETRKTVLNCLANDFDTSSAVSRIIQFITKANSAFNQKQNDLQTESCFAVAAAAAYVENFLTMSGFILNDSIFSKNKETEIGNILESSVRLRTKIRNLALNIEKKELTEMKTTLLGACDQFRNEMNVSGIELKDHGKTTSWKYSEKMKHSTKS
ncbi:cysteine--tRNA ligase-like protein, mitochondrial [Rhodnius prolixus]|uniref:cysteine--tRNA ligase-like protein, mitochondrial n=1 Tax=Rhodnius prolixus TaxID=13249 RepID=UPI003D18CA31